jgi:GTP diphosphokinase / guanosine-3',5'-bis(diphosphate) 3'-diphosphatase
VNHKLVPLSQPLRSGDQIEIITSKKQQPKEDWLNYVATARARHRIKQALRDQKKKLAVVGRETVQRQLRKWGAKADAANFALPSWTISAHNSTVDLFYQVARGKFDPGTPCPPPRCARAAGAPQAEEQREEKRLEEMVADIRGGDQGALLIGDDLQKIDYKLSPAATPSPATMCSASSPWARASRSTA